ncbi:hypothetical protein [Flavonifractor sp. An306]|uniref:hypothetical protein n=1 Tax=Flavonifractor sp. An306 TaxID=1965629 RepID=UPI000B380E60|nr:hypothetical protein [Flavonifractor sp. An306]OUO37872.1 hypothetical protein B5F88_12080 [Flavonifractor sp. An306]
MSKIDQSTLTRLLGNSLQQEVESQQRMDATVARIIGSGPAVTDQYKIAPQPGHGPGMYQPRARATGQDLVSLFIPADSFDVLEYKDFQRARDQAISWLRSHRYQVEDAQKLCWGPSFELDSSPLAYRDDTGRAWYNCSIDTEQDYLRARVTASY